MMGSLNLTPSSAPVKPCKVSPHSLYFMAVKRSKSLVEKGRSLTESGELLPWELLYAEWLVRLQKRPSIDVQIAAATELAREAGVIGDDDYIEELDLKRARLRKTWKRYFADLKSEGMRKARRMLVEHAPQYADAHIWSLHQARKFGDYKATAVIALPMLDRALPKHADGPQTAIQVNLTVQQADALTAPASTVEVDYEVIEDDSASETP